MSRLIRGVRARTLALTIGMLLLVSAVAAPSAPAFQIRCPGATAYPGDSAARPQLAVWMGRAVQRSGLPPELVVMAALVESGLENTRSGDDPDSVGFFQMRTDIWNQGEYAGFADDPALQIRWFINTATAVRTGAKNTGPGFRGNPDSWGQWIANFGRPDSPGFPPERYEARLAEARQLLERGM